MLNVEHAIESRYPDLFKRHRRFARTLSRFLGYLFFESRFQRFAEDYPHLSGFDFVEQVLRSFDFNIRLTEAERARIPSSGRVVIVANHPIGSLDGLALLHLVRGVRPDVKVVANELLTSIEPLHSVLLPVTNMGSRGSSRDNLRAIRRHLESGRALIIFPAGEVSRLAPGGVRDGIWQSGFIRFAGATRAPVLPIHVAGRNSLFFYSLSMLARPLSTLWLVREMFKQSHNTVDARIGRPIPHEIYSASGFAPVQLARMFRKHVYRLGSGGKPVFRSVETVAPPENRQLLQQELAGSESLGSTPDGKLLYLCDYHASPCVMRELGRSFVQPRYQTRHSLDYLWWGIGAFLKRNPGRFRYLFGPASISRHYGSEGTAMLTGYYGHYFAAPALGVRARNPLALADEAIAKASDGFLGDDAETDFRRLRARLAEQGLPVPTLYKHYAQSMRPGGVSFSAFNVDTDFGDCVDSFVLADLEQLTPRKRQRYLS
ncbi:MAG: 1-acyl-sn-glycerol-3-phosphate acyltransferase [Chromatocurvus sp.]